MKKCKVLSMMLIFFMTTLISSCSGPKLTVFSSKTDSTQTVDEDKIYEVKKTSLTSVTSGTALLVARRETSLYFNDVSGIITKLNIRVNDKIKPGQIIAEIVSEELIHEMEQLKLSLDKAQLELQQIELNIANETDDLEIYKMYLEDAKKALENDNNQENLNEYNRALITYRQGERSLEIAKKNREIANLEIESIEKSIKYTEQRLNDCKLVSRVEGIVTYIEGFSIMDYIPSEKIIAKVVEPRNIVVKFIGNNLDGLEYGMKVKVKLNDKEYDAVVYEPIAGDLIQPLDTTEESSNYIYLELEQQVEGLKLGEVMNASVSALIAEGVITIPRSALRTDGTKTWVEKYKDGKIEETEIVIGLESGPNIEVVKGLTEGDKIIKGY